jgi:Mg-chelatase subunit ChlD
MHKLSTFKFICLLTTFYFAQLLPALAQDNTRTVILFDRSASMNQMHEGARKIDLAKSLFASLIDTFENNPNVEIRFFAGGTSADKAIDCIASEVALGFGSAQGADALKSMINGVQALGHETPITLALEKAREDLAGWSGPRKIILISDGQETCNQDPEELAELFFEDGIIIDTIGIGPPDAFSQLGMIALSGGGTFQLAENLESLKSAFGTSLPGGVLSFGNQAGTAKPASPSSPASSASPTVALPPVVAFELPDEPQASGPVGVAVEIIFDASGSMEARLGGQTKLALAKAAIRAAAQGLNGENMHVAFRAYGFDRSVAKTKEASCPNTELLLPFLSSQQAEEVVAKADGLTAYGYTPIARSLELAGQDLLAEPVAKRMIILISDGEETCGGDPKAVAKQLFEMGIDLQTHVVGFDLDAVARRQMQNIAKEGGGNYYDAGDGAELGASLIKVIDLAQEVADPYDERLIRPVTGALTLEEATVLVGGIYTLVDHLPQGERRFFKVETKTAQRGFLRAIVQSRKAVFGDDGSAEESAIAYSGFTLRVYRPDGSEVKGHWAKVYGERGEQAHTGYVDQTGEGFYFSVGNAYDSTSRDALFQIVVDEAGDLTDRQDAPGKKDGEPIALAASVDSVGHLGLEDREDSFIVTLPANTESLNLTIAFTDPDFRFLFDVRTGETNKRIKRFTGQKGTGEFVLELPDGTTSVRLLIKDNNPGLDVMFSSYHLNVEPR